MSNKKSKADAHNYERWLRVNANPVRKQKNKGVSALLPIALIMSTPHLFCDQSIAIKRNPRRMR